MDHVDAIRLKTAEAYLLDELSLTERRDFEEHFFTCQQCANDLEAGAAFIDAYKMAHNAESAPRLAVVKIRHPQTFRPVYALAASVVFAFLLAYQNVITIPRLKQSAKAGVVESFSLESTASRGPSPTVIAPSQGKAFVILLDIPPGGGQSDYRCAIRSEAGAELASFKVSGASAQRTVPVLIPGSELKPGKYSLNVSREPRGTEDGGSVAQYPFEIR